MYESDMVKKLEDKGRSGPWSARINNTVIADGDDVFVTIPSIDGGEFKWGPCVWSPRVGDSAYPTKGFAALVDFDEEHKPWIIQWWPYG